MSWEGGTWTSKYDGKVLHSEHERDRYDREHFDPYGHECHTCGGTGTEIGGILEPNHDCEDCDGTGWLHIWPFS